MLSYMDIKMKCVNTLKNKHKSISCLQKRNKNNGLSVWDFLLFFYYILYLYVTWNIRCDLKVFERV